MSAEGSKKRHVYVAGPLTKPDPFANVHQAVKVAEELRLAGFVPFVPHLNVLWAMVDPSPTYQNWIDWCLAWIERCDFLVRIPGESSGSDIEWEYAGSLGKPRYLLKRVVHAGNEVFAWWLFNVQPQEHLSQEGG